MLADGLLHTGNTSKGKCIMLINCTETSTVTLGLLQQHYPIQIKERKEKKTKAFVSQFGKISSLLLRGHSFTARITSFPSLCPAFSVSFPSRTGNSGVKEQASLQLKQFGLWQGHLQENLRVLRSWLCQQASCLSLNPFVL